VLAATQHETAAAQHALRSPPVTLTSRPARVEALASQVSAPVVDVEPEPAPPLVAPAPIIEAPAPQRFEAAPAVVYAPPEPLTASPVHEMMDRAPRVIAPMYDLDEPEPEPQRAADFLTLVEDPHEDLDEATEPSILRAAIDVAPEPAPRVVPMPPPHAELREEDWEDNPTATRSAPRGRLRRSTVEDAGVTGFRSDVLRDGSFVRLTYLTEAPVGLTVSADDPHAPLLQAHIRGMAQEALARGSR
jgi:hypothetical protein